MDKQVWLVVQEGAHFGRQIAMISEAVSSDTQDNMLLHLYMLNHNPIVVAHGRFPLKLALVVPINYYWQPAHLLWFFLISTPTYQHSAGIVYHLLCT